MVAAIGKINVYNPPHAHGNEACRGGSSGNALLLWQLPQE